MKKNSSAATEGRRAASRSWTRGGPSGWVEWELDWFLNVSRRSQEEVSRVFAGKMLCEVDRVTTGQLWGDRDVGRNWRLGDAETARRPLFSHGRRDSPSCLRLQLVTYGGCWERRCRGASEASAVFAVLPGLWKSPRFGCNSRLECGDSTRRSGEENPGREKKNTLVRPAGKQAGSNDTQQGLGRVQRDTEIYPARRLKVLDVDG